MAVITVSLAMLLLFIIFIYPKFSKLVVANTEQEAIRVGRHLSAMVTDNDGNFDIDLIWMMIGDNIEQLQEEFNLAKLKVFLPSGKTLYSTDPAEVGKVNQNDYFYDQVAAGRTYSQLVKINRQSSDGHSYAADIVEIYIPLMNQGRFVGAVEIFYDVTARFHALHQVMWVCLVMVFIFCLAATLILYFLLRHLDATLTKQRLESQKLRISENRFSQIVDSSQEWIWEFDNQGCFIYTSSVVETLLGYKPEEFVGLKYFHDILPPETRDGMKKFFSDSLARRAKISNLEFACRNSKGDEIWLVVNAMPIIDPEGIVVGYRGVAADITERKIYEQRLQQDIEEQVALADAQLSAEKVVVEDRDKLQKALDEIALLIRQVAEKQDFSIRFSNPNLLKCYEVKQCNKPECPCFGKEPARCWQDAGTWCGGVVQGKFAQKIENCSNCQVFIDATDDPTYKIGEYFNNMMHILEQKNNKLLGIQQELRRSAEFTSTVLNSINDSICIIDVNTFQIVGANSVFLKEFGLTEMEAIGRTCHGITHHSDIPCQPPDDICPLHDTIANGVHTVVEHIHYDWDNNKEYVEVATSPIYDENGAVSQVVHVSRNITERKLAEERVKESEERFRSVMQTADDAIISVDRNGLVIHWNRGAEKIFGYTAEEMVGRDVAVIMPERFREQHTQGMARLAAGGEKHVIGHTVELMGLRQDGSEFPVELSLASWMSKNQVYYTGIIRDVTERREMEYALIHEKESLLQLTDELEAMNSSLKETQAQMLQREKMASIGQLAAGVAHEINNPMGFITSNIGTLGKYVEKFVEAINGLRTVAATCGQEEQAEKIGRQLKLDFVIDDVRDLLAESLDGARRVTEIVRNLKSFSRIDESEASLSDINDCLETTLKIIWNELKYKATVHKQYGELASTFCNPQQLNQVFMNLLVNAAHAIEETGDITIRTWQEDDSILVAITDTGSGIAPENLGRLFEPFFTTKAVGKGTGLGLSIAYDIITKKHNGEIIVDSVPGKGTTFTVKIPVIKEG